MTDICSVVSSRSNFRDTHSLIAYEIEGFGTGPHKITSLYLSENWPALLSQSHCASSFLSAASTPVFGLGEVLIKLFETGLDRTIFRLRFALIKYEDKKSGQTLTNRRRDEQTRVETLSDKQTNRH